MPPCARTWERLRCLDLGSRCDVRPLQVALRRPGALAGWTSLARAALQVVCSLTSVAARLVPSREKDTSQNSYNQNVFLYL